MADHSFSQAIWILDKVTALVKLFIWPAFLWFFTKRPDVREHIQQLLTREWRVKVPGASFVLTNPEAPKSLPREEREKLLPGPPKPRASRPRAEAPTAPRRNRTAPQEPATREPSSASTGN